jgi:hypothetical protein
VGALEGARRGGGVKLAEALNKNKEVIATAVAAFALGVFVSNRIFCRN